MIKIIGECKLIYTDSRHYCKKTHDISIRGVTKIGETDGCQEIAINSKLQNTRHYYITVVRG
jgi:hypothetical protein